jgi:2-phospho-L-lactate guanylyltransferase
MEVVILVPVKEQSKAKARMAPLLTAEERAQIAWAMFEDVAQTLAALAPPARIVLITDSMPAADTARRMNWRVLWETEQISESASVDAASAFLAQEGVEAVLRVPADLPLLRPEDIREIMEPAPGPNSATLVPSWDRLGTNAVLRAPPLLFPSRFGHNSLVLHTQEAMRARASLRIVENSRIALDVDDASDIQRFLEVKSDTNTARLLRALEMEERLGRHVV